MTVILARYSEIGLKSPPVRRRFEHQLLGNMEEMLMEDGIEAVISHRGARIYVETERPDDAVATLRRVFGIASLSVVEETGSSMEEICALAAEYSLSRLSPGRSFAVKARREGSQGYSSMDVGREAGSAIFIANEDKGVKVDLTDPDTVFHVEVRDNKAYVFSDIVRCHAGLPVGSQGRVIAVADDDRGIVSAWLMMKRGCRLVISGSADWSPLRRYDVHLREGTEDKRALAYVLGTDLDGFGSVDPQSYPLPVFFPTIGMTDEDVEGTMDVIRRGLRRPIQTSAAAGRCPAADSAFILRYDAPVHSIRSDGMRY